MITVTETEQLTDKNHLAKVMLEKSSIPGVTIERALSIINAHLECCVELCKDGYLIGYSLVFNFFGVRSFHAYKLIDGYGVWALRTAKRMIEKFGVDIIDTTVDQTNTIRAAGVLGFKEIYRDGQLLRFRRMA
jgi:hypothetical protein